VAPELPVLAEFQGVIKAEVPKARSDPRLALVWLHDHILTDPDHGRQELGLSHDVPVEMDGLSSEFRLRLSRPPPEQTVLGYDELRQGTYSEWAQGGRTAIGVVVVYEDRNRDRRLTFVETEDTLFLDEVIGHGSGYLLWYQEGDLPKISDLEGRLEVGFNLIRTSPCFVGLDADQRCAEFPAIRVESKTASFPIRLSGDPQLNKLLCKPLWNRGERIPDENPCRSL
jgi:hypothetical protein